MKMDTESAVGGIITLVFVFVLSMILFILIGYGIDRFTLTAAHLFTGTPSSQMRFDVFNLQVMAFRAEPFIVLIGLGINYWITEIRQQGGMITLSTMLLGTSEMIFLTLVGMAMELFGGFGIDQVIIAVSNWKIIGAGIDLYSAVQYIGPVFYGVCFLVTLAGIIQYVVMCVSVSDYSQSYTY